MYQEILWCKKGTSDKIWGVMQISNGTASEFFYTVHNFVVFWGRRGHALQTQIVEGSIYEMENKVRMKKNKGYCAINKKQLYNVYPEFSEDLNKLVFIAKLSQ